MHPHRAYCVGRLYVDGQFFCHTLEPYDFGFTQLAYKSAIEAQKKAHTCAIPSGKYAIAMHIHSPRFGSVDFYKQNCSGFLPRLMGVPCYEGVLIHAGNTENDTQGCILVGVNNEVGRVNDSRSTFLKLYRLMKAAARNMEGIYITIDRTYPVT